MSAERRHKKRPDAFFALHFVLHGKNLPAGCEGCIYRRPLMRNGIYTVCHFCYDTGLRRGCPAEKCTRKKVKK